MYCTLSQLKSNWCPYRQALRCDGVFLLLSTEQAVRQHGPSTLPPSCPWCTCTSGPEAIGSNFDKVQHQNKIMRQIRGFKMEGGEGGGYTDEKEEIQIHAWLLFWCQYLDLDWPHQLPPRWTWTDPFQHSFTFTFFPGGRQIFHNKHEGVYFTSLAISPKSKNISIHVNR